MVAIPSASVIATSIISRNKSPNAAKICGKPTITSVVDDGKTSRGMVAVCFLPFESITVIVVLQTSSTDTVVVPSAKRATARQLLRAFCNLSLCISTNALSMYDACRAPVSKRTLGTVIASTSVSIKPFFSTCLTRDPPGNVARKVSYSNLSIAGSITAPKFACCSTLTLP